MTVWLDRGVVQGAENGSRGLEAGKAPEGLGEVRGKVAQVSEREGPGGEFGQGIECSDGR